MDPIWSILSIPVPRETTKLLNGVNVIHSSEFKLSWNFNIQVVFAEWNVGRPTAHFSTQDSLIMSSD